MAALVCELKCRVEDFKDKMSRIQTPLPAQMVSLEQKNALPSTFTDKTKLTSEKNIITLFERGILSLSTTSLTLCVT